MKFRILEVKRKTGQYNLQYRRFWFSYWRILVEKPNLTTFADFYNYCLYTVNQKRILIKYEKGQIPNIYNKLHVKV